MKASKLKVGDLVYSVRISKSNVVQISEYTVRAIEDSSIDPFIDDEYSLGEDELLVQLETTNSTYVFVIFPKNFERGFAKDDLIIHCKQGIYDPKKVFYTSLTKAKEFVKSYLKGKVNSAIEALELIVELEDDLIEHQITPYIPS